MSVHLAVDAREWVRARRTGIGRYLETSLRSLLPIRPAWRFTLFLGPDGEERVEAPALTFRTLPSGPTPWIDQVVLPRHVREAGADLFFSPYLKMPWSLPCPGAVTIHDLFPLTLPPDEGGLGPVGRLRMKLYAGISVRRAAAVLTVSEASARAIRQQFDPREGRLHVVPEAVDERFFETGADPGAAGIEGPYLLALSNFEAHKNIEVLLEAWSACADRTRDALLVLAGTGGRRDALRRRAEGMAGADRIVWPGRVPDERLPGLYRGARALLQPSYAEGFGLPVAEAMACGTPAAVSDRGSLPEVGGAGVQVLDPDDVEGWAEAMTAFLQDEDLREELANRAREEARRFAPGRTGEALAGLFQGLLG